MTRTLRDLGEREVIRRLLGAKPSPTSDVPASGPAGSESATHAMVVGAGDDAAVLRPRAGRELVATTDTLLEGVHFRRDWIEAAALGARLVEANASDLAAMAAEPRWALVSFGARPDHAIDDLLETQRGIIAALAGYGAVVAGGNLTAVRSEEWMTLTLLGEVEPGRVWTRSRARPGDLIAITGRPGRAGAGSALAIQLGGAAREPRWAELIEAWRAPRARVGFALALARTGAVTAAIDLSDGVSSDLAHLCEASGVGARLEARAWPEDATLESAAAALGSLADVLRLGASDDYELLLAIGAAERAGCERVAAQLSVPLAFIGAITAVPGRLEWVGLDGSIREIESRGYDHYSGGTGTR